MKCEDCSKMLFDYLWGNLDVQSAANIKAHLDSGCLWCNQEMSILQSPTTALVSELAPVQPPVELKTHVMSLVAKTTNGSEDFHGDLSKEAAAQLAALPENYVQLSALKSIDNNSTLRMWSIVLAGCLIGVVFGYATVYRSMHPTEQEAVQIATQERDNSPAIDSGIRLVKLASTNSSNEKDAQASGHVVFDLIGNQVHVLTSNLLDSFSNVDYDVWLTNDKSQNLLLGKLQKSETQGVWINYFDLPHQVMNIEQIAIARSSGKKSELIPSDVRLRVQIAPPITLK